MPDFFGVRATEKRSALTAPVTAQTATMAFGTAPVHQTGGGANEIVLVFSYAEAIEKLGWSDDWKKYTLCEVIDSHFKLYGVGPLLLVNVMDPKLCAGEEKTEEKAFQNGQIKLGADVIPGSVKLARPGGSAAGGEGAGGEGAGETGTAGEENPAPAQTDTYEAGVDYELFFEDGECVIEALEGGALENAKSVEITFKEVEFSAEDMTDKVIGGYSVRDGSSRGMELVDKAFFEAKVLPSILIAPGFSSDPGVAAVMTAKAKSFSIVFRSFALCDLSAKAGTGYQDAVKEKDTSWTFQQAKERLCWPMVESLGKRYHLSTHMAGRMSALEAESNGVPSEPASNKPLMADKAVLEDGTPVTMDLNMANYVRGQGITTTLNFVNGFTSWGEYCACAPQNTDMKDMYCNIARMVNYIANTVILTFWAYTDRKLNPRLASSICSQIDIWLNGLKRKEHLLGGRCVLLSEENPIMDLMAGIVRPHIYLGVPGPAQEIEFIVECDVTYLENLFNGLFAA